MQNKDRMADFEQHYKGSFINGEQVVDELCRCGHRRSEHQDISAMNLKTNQAGIIALGQGGCLCCGCSKFTWKSFITKEDTDAKDNK